ncbi:putative polyketide synthase [Mycobacterium xenopi 4042]|uniref:Putative polyketide synthase n=1 Tax=Mycobacterium xenopi 4042 TaxID=1299334 RepID=X7YLY0_MYCXE|nr:putative polyketide synthase [Mycobacterium xenopi 4042]
MSSFGISGTNAHVIIESAPRRSSGAGPSEHPATPVVPWVVSARPRRGCPSRRADGRAFDRAFRAGPVDVGWSLAAVGVRAPGGGPGPIASSCFPGWGAGAKQSGAAVIHGNVRPGGKTVFVFPVKAPMARHGQGTARRIPGVRRSIQQRCGRAGPPSAAAAA